jgi:hypothetical protein
MTRTNGAGLANGNTLVEAHKGDASGQRSPSRTDSRRQRDWVAEIAEQWRKAVSGIVGAGKLLLEAQDRMPRGAWLEMVEGRLPFGSRTAQRLMEIARHPALSPHWGTFTPQVKVI